MESFGGSFATCSDGNYRGLKFSPMEANMETRLEGRKSFVPPVAVLLTKFPCNKQLAALSKFLDVFLFN